MFELNMRNLFNCPASSTRCDDPWHCGNLARSGGGDSAGLTQPPNFDQMRCIATGEGESDAHQCP
jgi:hypothetical protein